MTPNLNQIDFDDPAVGIFNRAHEEDTPAPIAQLRLEPKAAEPSGLDSRLALSSTKSVLLDRAYQDFCQRRDGGERVDPDWYCAQFPSMKSSLGRVIQAHLFLEENSALFAETPELHWPEIGELFLDYQLKLELGKGAFARVFLAAETRVGNRLVAVKIALHGADSEADVLGRIKHPNIVPIHSVPKDPATGLTAVCMPYLGSATLEDVLDKAFSPTSAQERSILDAAKDLPHPLDPSAFHSAPAPLLQKGTYLDGIRLIGAQLADALAYLHEMGICHRDLKPSNVLLSPEGVPMLLDFNLCADARQPLKRLGGTMPYMSPEQLRATDMEGASGDAPLDARADIFSLGVILYQLVTGAHPFGPVPLKLSSADLRRHLLERQQQGPLEARQLNPNVDASLSRLLQRCLAHDPKDRPAAAALIASELRQELAPVPRTKRWIGRHPRQVLTAVALLVALSLVGFALAAMRLPYSERQLGSGLELYQQGQYRKAVSHFNDALDVDPSNRAARFARAQAHQQLGDFDLALQDYQEADRQSPDGRLKAALGYCLNRTGNDRDADECYRLAIELGFATAEVFNNRAYGFRKLNKLKEARESLDRAIKLDPRLQAAYHNRALVAYTFALTKKNKLDPTAKDKEIYRDLELGIADAQAAITLGSPSAELYLDAARLCALAARVDADWISVAIRHLEQAVEGGIEPKECTDSVFAPLQNEPSFQKLGNRPRPEHPLPATRRIVDPAKDFAR